MEWKQSPLTFVEQLQLLPLTFSLTFPESASSFPHPTTKQKGQEGDKGCRPLEEFSRIRIIPFEYYVTGSTSPGKSLTCFTIVKNYNDKNIYTGNAQST